MGSVRRGLRLAVALPLLLVLAASPSDRAIETTIGHLRMAMTPQADQSHLMLLSSLRQLRDPWPTDWGKLTYFGVGGLIYSVLSICQYRFYWWPLHPVGLTVATTWMVRRIAVSVFIAWALK